MMTESEFPGPQSENSFAADDATQQELSLHFPVDSILSGEEGEKLLRELYPKDDIYTHISLQGKEVEVFEYLDAHLDRSTTVNAIALLVAATKLGIVVGLNYRVATRLFGNFCSKSLFNSYYNETGGRKIADSVIESYMTALKNYFSLQ